MRYVFIAVTTAVSCYGLAFAQTLPAFEVASIKPSGAATPSWTMGCANRGPVGNIPAGRCVGSNVTLLALIAQAYNLPASSAGQRVSGLPGWAGKQRFDLEAKAEAATAPEAELRLMLRRLLAERFKLQLHEEEKEVDGYALVVAKGGPKLTKLGEQKRPAQPMTLALRATTTDSLANALATRLRRPVVNRTSITGAYDFTVYMKSIAEESAAAASLFTVIEEEFGLKLDAQKVPLKVFVVDHVEQPTEN